MTKVTVIDTCLEPRNATQYRDAVRIIECDILGWADGKVVRMMMRQQPEHVERWRVFEDREVGWIAWVIRPDDDRRVESETANGRFELVLIFLIGFLASVMAAIVLVVLPHCEGVFDG